MFQCGAIARDKKAIDVVNEAGVNNPLEGDQRGIFDEFLRRRGDSFGRRKSRSVQLVIKKEARRVNAAKRIHRPDGSKRGHPWPGCGKCTPDGHLRKPRICPKITVSDDANSH